MTTEAQRLTRATQSSELRREADQLNDALRGIDRHGSKDNRDKHALLRTRIMALHDTARKLLQPATGE